MNRLKSWGLRCALALTFLFGLSVTVQAQIKVKYRVEFTKTGYDVPISVVEKGTDFLMRVYVEDVRPQPDGILSAFVDVDYTLARATLQGGLLGGPDFFVTSSDDATAVPGFINEGGSMSCIMAPNGPVVVSLPSGERLLFHAICSADAFGPANFATNATDEDIDSNGGQKHLFTESAITLFAAPSVSSGDLDLFVKQNDDIQNVEFGAGELEIRLGGDANRDGAVDVSDFNIWNTHKFTTGTDWSQGDFNGDGVTDVSDFNIWNTNKFQSYNYPE